jgi:hypothetical protein
MSILFFISLLSCSHLPTDGIPAIPPRTYYQLEIHENTKNNAGLLKNPKYPSLDEIAVVIPTDQPRALSLRNQPIPAAESNSSGEMFKCFFMVLPMILIVAKILSDVS